MSSGFTLQLHENYRVLNTGDIPFLYASVAYHASFVENDVVRQNESDQ